MSAAPLTALILAGERGGANPVAEAAGVSEKCWAPVAGVPMVLRVVACLARCRGVGRIAVALQSGATDADLAALSRHAGGIELRVLPCGDCPTGSILAAVDALREPYPLLITTADHPLLRPEMVEHFWQACAASRADIAAAVTPASVIQGAYPESQRTYLRFADGRRSGANLFALLTPQGRRAIEFWRRIEQNRKRPWRLMSAFGLAPLLAYLLGRLTVADAARRASEIVGAEAAIVDLPFAEAAIDVDKPADFVLVDRILRDREAGHVPAGAPL
ncbi:MAG: nucleotidyltransferase family protein [Kiloniellales bacterium]|nr:nucleotidyltransferase family protein [Kiloniellales bacterium]